MSDTVTLRKVGNSAGVTFGKEVLEVLNVAIGEKLHVIRTPNGIRQGSGLDA